MCRRAAALATLLVVACASQPTHGLPRAATTTTAPREQPPPTVEAAPPDPHLDLRLNAGPFAETPSAEPDEAAGPLTHTHVTSAQSSGYFRAFDCVPPSRVCGLSAPLHSDACQKARAHDHLSYRARMLQLAEDTDFIELTSVASQRGRAVTRDELAPLARAGKECAGARDHLACARALAEARSSLVDAYTCGARACKDEVRVFGVLTRGDSVKLLRTSHDFRALLGTIDSPAEAWLMLMVRGDHADFQCDDLEHARHRKRDDGYELGVRTEERHCSAASQRVVTRDYTYRVDAGGKVTRTHVATTTEARGGCSVAASARG